LFNGAVYEERWSNVQFEIFDPADLGSQAFVANGANYQVKGLELQLVARIVEGLTIQGGASWNSSEQTNSPALIANNPQSVNYGKPITTIASPYGEVGSSLAQSPPFQANMRARYERNVASYLAFAQAGAVHTAHSLSVVGNAPSIAPAGSTSQAFDQPGYTTYDAALGVSKDALDCAVLRPKYHRHARQGLYQRLPGDGNGDRDPATGARSKIWLSVLSATRNDDSRAFTQRRQRLRRE
jgi:outer membrane receptor protein involved in Fe transport